MAENFRLSQPVVFIEGVDKSGKSTLASFLAARLGGTIFHMTEPEPQSTYLGLVYDTAKPVIFDRGYLSTLAYDKILNRRSYGDYSHMVSRLHREYPVFQILLYGDPEKLAERQTIDDVPLSISYQQLVFSVYGAETGFSPVYVGRSKFEEDIAAAIVWSLDNWGEGFGHPLSPLYLRSDVGMERYISFGYSASVVRVDTGSKRSEYRTPSGRRVRNIDARPLNPLPQPQVLAVNGFSQVLADIQGCGVV